MWANRGNRCEAANWPCLTLLHPDPSRRAIGLLYLSGPGLEGAATGDRVRAARLARLTEAERARLLAAEHRPSDDGDDEDATIARLLWLTDFADRSRRPTSSPRPCSPTRVTRRPRRSVRRYGVSSKPCEKGLRAAGLIRLAEAVR